MQTKVNYNCNCYKLLHTYPSKRRPQSNCSCCSSVTEGAAMEKVACQITVLQEIKSLSKTAHSHNRGCWTEAKTRQSCGHQSKFYLVNSKMTRSSLLDEADLSNAADFTQNPQKRSSSTVFSIVRTQVLYKANQWICRFFSPLFFRLQQAVCFKSFFQVLL